MKDDLILLARTHFTPNEEFWCGMFFIAFGSLRILQVLVSNQWKGVSLFRYGWTEHSKPIVILWGIGYILIGTGFGILGRFPRIPIALIMIVTLCGGIILCIVAGLNSRRPKPGKAALQGDRCLHCGYSLTGNVSGVCPECGTAIASDTSASTSTETSSSINSIL